MSDEQALKNDSGKERLELVPAQFILDIAAVLTHGAEKYDEWNWTKGLPWLRTYASVLRHLSKWALGEDIDPESGLSHLAHAATNIMFLLTWAKTKKGVDDRMKI